MLSFLKKKTDASAPAEVAAWHPNFRNFKALPDTKVVRTAFALNGVFVLVAAVLLTWFAFRAYQLHELTTQIDQWQRQIDRDSGPSAQAVALYKKFQAESTKVEEVNAFVQSRPVVSELVMHLASTLPSFLALDRFDLNAVALNIRGSIRGAPDQASGRASTYLQQLKADPFYAPWFSEINLVSLNRDPKTGGLVVEISFKLREARKP